jgi:hypothetical protein
VKVAAAMRQGREKTEKKVAVLWRWMEPQVEMQQVLLKVSRGWFEMPCP